MSKIQGLLIMKKLTLLLLVVLSQSVFAKHVVVYMDNESNDVNYNQSMEVATKEIVKDERGVCDAAYSNDVESADGDKQKIKEARKTLRECIYASIK